MSRFFMVHCVYKIYARFLPIHTARRVVSGIIMPVHTADVYCNVNIMP